MIQRARCHNRRYVTPEAKDQRDKRFTGQTDFLHHFIQNKCSTRHVTGAF
ncbi:Uncharacterised protein [Vibrio cholerae]|nr:Uncharacterised protein [Vibrio cholerae]